MIHAFTGGNDGSGPGARLTIDNQGNLCGVAPTGGANGLGTIYQIRPDGNNWTLNVIHTFTGGADGASGSAGQMLFRGGLLYEAGTAGRISLTTDAVGNFYGATVHRGVDGEGAIYQFTPDQKSGDSARMLLQLRVPKR